MIEGLTAAGDVKRDGLQFPRRKPAQRCRRRAVNSQPARTRCVGTWEAASVCSDEGQAHLAEAQLCAAGAAGKGASVISRLLSAGQDRCLPVRGRCCHPPTMLVQVIWKLLADAKDVAASRTGRVDRCDITH
jgi:hypothetical protein